MNPSGPPHQGVYTRLKPSPLHGVGVFAIRNIPAGTNLFATDEADMYEVPAAHLRGRDAAIRDLYDAFCVREDGRLFGPRSFNALTVAWYLNNSERPNVECDGSFNFTTIRDVRDGEELTVDYATYSAAAVERKRSLP
jgi:hypothetical protein